MSALRLARAYTGRNKIIKFEGGYHGHSDGLLVKAGSGAATFGTPSSPGVPGDYARHTLTAPYNDVEAVEELAEKNKNDLAAVIVEPVAGNMGVIPPAEGFLQGLRKVCDETDALLILDEVITGFRVARGGAQERFGVKADITCLGKILGGGLPLGAYGANAEIMDNISPVGPVYQSGTLSGNPVAVAAGIATLRLTSEKGFYGKLEEKGKRLAEGIKAGAKDAGVDVCVNRVGSMMTAFFTTGPVNNYRQAASADLELFKKWFHGLLDRGIYVAPSAFEAAFVSSVHEESQIDQTVKAAAEAFAESVE